MVVSSGTQHNPVCDTLIKRYSTSSGSRAFLPLDHFPLVLMGVSLSTQTSSCTSHVCVKLFVETYGIIGALRYELQSQNTAETQPILRRLDEIVAMLKKAQNDEISNDMHPRTCIMCRELPNVTLKLRQYHYNTLSRDLETAVEDLYKQLSSVRMLNMLP
ncbi:hypothetical protein F5887DRAFT_998899 [Amanita rubescens]|nr:hypothetical protein F5887DRAFT_998899 [Amanita rubescens]